MRWRVDHIDTAQYYGPARNELIREALYPYPATLALVSRSGRAVMGPADGLPTTSLISCGGHRG
jgi:aryl-alcohol dehydrogenase-like predicted oxidoreductase